MRYYIIRDLYRAGIYKDFNLRIFVKLKYITQSQASEIMRAREV
jgi:hypothetical protein